MAATTPFEVLGVPLEVNDAELKRAYFRKLREHPPETDADGYHRVHEAYEALKDPTARRHATELARAATIDPRVLQLLEVADAELRKGERAAAATALREAVALAPDFSLARERLINLLIAMEAKQEAIAHLEALVARRADSLELQLVIAQTYASMYEYAAAQAALVRAKALGADDRRPLLVETRMHAQMEKWDEALAALEAMLALPDRGVMSDADVLVERLHLNIARGALGALPADLERLARVGEQSAEAKQEVTTALQTMAAHCLQRKHRPQARACLELAAKVSGRPHVPMGPAVSCRLDQLPPEGREVIEKIRATKAPGAWFRVPQPPFNAPAALLVGGLAGAVIFGGLSLWWGVALSVLSGVGGIMWARRVNARRAALPVDFVLLRPFHLIRVVGSEALLIPLMNIATVNLRPAGETVTMTMHEGPPLELSISPEAQQVLNVASAQQVRIFDLLPTDLLQAELAREPIHWAPVKAG